MGGAFPKPYLSPSFSFQWWHGICTRARGIMCRVDGNSGSPGQLIERPAVVQGTLTREHIAGRQMSGFIETGILGGIALCSLVRRDPNNPAVEAIFASPEEHQELAGVRGTVSLYTDPVGDVTFSLLHLAAQAEVVPQRLA